MKYINLSKNSYYLLLLLLCFTTIVQAQPPGSGWTISYAEEFDGDGLNESRWTARTNGVFKRNAVEVSNNTLKIRNSVNSNGEISGGWISSNQQFAGPGNIKYGFYEAKVRITSNPNGSIWPTWWIWGNRVNGVTTTEFDLMEYSGFAAQVANNRATSSHHYRGKLPIDGATVTKTLAEDGFNRDAFNWHRWGMLWTPTEVTFFYDGQCYMTSYQPLDAAVENNPLRLIFSSSPHTINADPEQPDNPIPGNAPQPGQALPTFEVDWVRVYTKNNASSNCRIQRVALQNLGNYVSSEDGTQPMNCNRTSVGIWEEFDWITVGKDKMALRGNNRRFVSSENGNQPMNCNRTSAEGWEAFTPQHLGNQVYAFRGVNNQYVSSKGGTQPMACNVPSIGSTEQFAVTWFGPGSRQAVATQSLESAGGLSTLYPNPVIGQSFTLKVTAPQGGEARISAIDRLGRQTGAYSIGELGQGVTSLEITTDVLQIATNGWYLIKLEVGNTYSYHKILVQQ